MIVDGDDWKNYCQTSIKTKFFEHFYKSFIVKSLKICSIVNLKPYFNISL